MNPLKLWEHRTFFAEQTINRLEDARLIFNRFALLSYPPADDEKGDRRLEIKRQHLQKQAQTFFFTQCAANLSKLATDTEKAREIFRKAVEEFPQGPRHTKGQYYDFFTLRPQWQDYKARFEHFSKPQEINGRWRRFKSAEYAVIGWYIATLPKEEFNELTKSVCEEIPELKEFAALWVDTKLPLPLLL